LDCRCSAPLEGGKRMSCKIEHCDRPIRSRGWCGMHYARWVRTGNPMLKLRARGVLDAPVLRRAKVQVPETRSRKICGLTKGQFAVMVAIAKGNREIEDIARDAGLTPLSVTRHVSSIRLRCGYEAVKTVIPPGEQRGTYVLG